MLETRFHCGKQVSDKQADQHENGQAKYEKIIDQRCSAAGPKLQGSVFCLEPLCEGPVKGNCDCQECQLIPDRHNNGPFYGAGPDPPGIPKNNQTSQPQESWKIPGMGCAEHAEDQACRDQVGNSWGPLFFRGWP